MADSNMQLQWTDDQWNKVRQVVYEEARRARVAGNVLPLYGPLEPDARSLRPGLARHQVRRVRGDRHRLVGSGQTLRRWRAYLQGAQVSDPELTSALIAFRRAANPIARREAEVILREWSGRGRRGWAAAPKPPSRPISQVGRIGRIRASGRRSTERQQTLPSGQRSQPAQQVRRTATLRTAQSERPRRCGFTCDWEARKGVSPAHFGTGWTPRTLRSDTERKLDGVTARSYPPVSGRGRAPAHIGIDAHTGARHCVGASRSISSLLPTFRSGSFRSR